LPFSKVRKDIKMTEKTLKCNSCKKELLNDKGATIFKCPNCGKGEILRCYHCREIAAKYKCPLCSFEGPN